MSPHWTLFNFSRANHLSLSIVVSDDDHDRIVGRWLNGRIFGYYVNVMIPWRGQYRRLTC